MTGNACDMQQLFPSVGGPFCGLVLRALLCGVYLRAADLWRLPMSTCYILTSLSGLVEHSWGAAGGSKQVCLVLAPATVKYNVI